MYCNFSIRAPEQFYLSSSPAMMASNDRPWRFSGSLPLCLSSLCLYSVCCVLGEWRCLLAPLSLLLRCGHTGSRSCDDDFREAADRGGRRTCLRCTRQNISEQNEEADEMGEYSVECALHQHVRTALHRNAFAASTPSVVWIMPWTDGGPTSFVELQRCGCGIDNLYSQNSGRNE